MGERKNKREEEREKELEREEKRERGGIGEREKNERDWEKLWAKERIKGREKEC